MKIVDDPRVSFILHLFYHFKNAKDIIKSVLQCGEDVEIIVLNDSDGKNFNEIYSLLPKRNNYQLCLHDLNEVRAFNQGIKFANSNICIISQDDDIPPSSNWLEKSMWYMKEYNLSVLGLNRGSEKCWFSHNKNYDFGAEATGNFRFVSWCNFGPWLINRNDFLNIGMFSTKYSEVGEHSGGADSDICARLWINGYRVGLLDINPQWNRHVGGRASQRDSITNKKRKTTIDKNWGIYKKDYINIAKNIEELVDKENKNL